MTRKGRRRLIWGTVLAALILIQFFRPEKNIGDLEGPDDFIQVSQVPDTLARVFMASCYDCHSNHTQYPWYSAIAPASWFLNQHVVNGKAHLNFSSWGIMDEAQKISQLNDICEECSNGDMPLKSYLLIHRAAKLSPETIEAICAWAEQEAEEILESGIR